MLTFGFCRDTPLTEEKIPSTAARTNLVSIHFGSQYKRILSVKTTPSRPSSQQSQQNHPKPKRDTLCKERESEQHLQLWEHLLPNLCNQVAPTPARNRRMYVSKGIIGFPLRKFPSRLQWTTSIFLCKSPKHLKDRSCTPQTSRYHSEFLPKPSKIHLTQTPHSPPPFPKQTLYPPRNIPFIGVRTIPNRDTYPSSSLSRSRSSRTKPPLILALLKTRNNPLCTSYHPVLQPLSTWILSRCLSNWLSLPLSP